MKIDPLQILFPAPIHVLEHKGSLKVVFEVYEWAPVGAEWLIMSVFCAKRRPIPKADHSSWPPKSLVSTQASPVAVK